MNWLNIAAAVGAAICFLVLVLVVLSALFALLAATLRGYKYRHAFRHPIRMLDCWWLEASPQRRLDRNPGNLCMLLGLMLPCLAIILQGPVPNSALRLMPEGLQVAMCACIFGGLGIKLHGAMSGSRFYFPRTSLKKSYQWGYTGAPVATMGTFVYGYYILAGTPNFLSALGGVSTPMFGMGVSITAVLYWLESRRIERNEQILTEQAVEVIRNDLDTDS